MADVLYTISKYLIIILFACFVYASFGVCRQLPAHKLKKKYNTQRVLMIFIHFLAFLSIGIKVLQGKAVDVTLRQLGVFYLAQLAYIIITACILPRVLTLNRALNNCMLMFICVGMIIQMRLGYSAALRQFYMIAGGTVLYVIFAIVIKKVNFARNLKWLYCIAGVALLILVLVLAGVSGGAKTYLDLGIITFQPLEFVKILFVLFVAAFFYTDRSYKTVLITGIMAAAHVLILVACNDLGGALILAVIYVLMVYAAKKDWKILLIGLVLFGVACVCAYSLFSHVQTRVTAWLDPFSDISGAGYQIAQSLFAIGTGGWFGMGLYSGSPKTIPEVTNDMVFSAIAEELGVFFGILLILLWLCFILMIFRVSLRLSNIFHKLVCFGMGLAFGVQVFLNIGGAVKFIPLTGVNLPFISSGGSSMFASMIMIGMVQALYVISEVDVLNEREAAAFAFDKRFEPESAPAARQRDLLRTESEDAGYTPGGYYGGKNGGGTEAYYNEEDYESIIAAKVRNMEEDNSENKTGKKKKVRKINPEDF